MKMLRWIQGNTSKYRIRNEMFRSDAMVKPITTYVTQIRLSWYGHAMRRDDTNVTKEVSTMKVGGKRPRGRPRLRWMDRVRSDLRQHHLDTELAQNREAWRKAIMVIDPRQGYDRQRWATVALHYIPIFGNITNMHFAYALWKHFFFINTL